MSVDTKRYESAATKRARALADMKMWSSHEIKRARQEIRSLADEVDRLREDARVDDEDCAQALKTNGELCDNNAELQAENERLKKHLAERHGCDIAQDDPDYGF